MSCPIARARRLVDQVHFVLGRYADNDWRSGWISGLDEPDASEHPTAGGLLADTFCLPHNPAGLRKRPG